MASSLVQARGGIIETGGGEVNLERVSLLASRLKLNMLRTIESVQTGHLGACCSSTELLSVLYFTDILQMDSDDPKNPDRDYVLVRGHLGPLRYNLFAMFGWMDQEEMKHYRGFGTRLQGHEDMNKTPGVDITPSGSLGMLLSYAVGARYSFRERGMENIVFCFLGDGEEQEGNVSEAARHAAKLKLDGLIAIIDKNGKQLSTATQNVDGADLEKTWSGYGWTVLEIENGHEIREIYDVYKEAVARSSAGPVCIIAHTVKGNGIPGAVEHRTGYHVFHNSAAQDQVTKEHIDLEAAIGPLSKEIDGKAVEVPKKSIGRRRLRIEIASARIPKLEPEPETGERLQYNYLEEFLNKLSGHAEARPIYVLTADYPPRILVYGKGFSIPNLRYNNVGIREQHVLAMAHGIRSVEKDSEIIVLCGDAFLYRFADQMNVLAQSKDKVTMISVEGGMSGAKNGSTHQSSGQPGYVATMPGVAMFEPASKLDMFYALNQSLQTEMPTYVRMNTSFTLFDYGGFREGPFYEIPIAQGVPDLTIAASGMLVREVCGAARKLLLQGIKARVLNVVNPKEPKGIAGLVEPDKPLFVYYNGNPIVLSQPITRELVIERKSPSVLIERGFELGTTGSISELMAHLGLDSNSISGTVLQHLRR